MSQPETPAGDSVHESWRYDPKIRFAIQVFQFFVMIMLLMLVFVQKHNGEKDVVVAQQKAYQTESELNRQIYDLKQELAKAQARIKELEKAAAK